jgi:hypothetical protein
VGGLARPMRVPSSNDTRGREGMRDTREIVVSVVGYLLFVAMASAIVFAVLTF